MLPPWMTEKLEEERRVRREREAQEQPRLEIEIQPPSEERGRSDRQGPVAGSSVVTIQVW